MAVLLLSVALVACDSGSSDNSVKNKGSGTEDGGGSAGGGSAGGGDQTDGGTEDDGGQKDDDDTSDDVTADLKVNPLLSGEFPDEPFTVHSGVPIDVDGDAYAIETELDPDAKTFTMTINYPGKTDTVSGTFDPKTGEMKASNCKSSDCFPFDSDGVYMIDASALVGDGRVVLDHERYVYHAVSATDESQMPAGRVTYEGQFFGDYTYADFYHDETRFPNIEGKATTTVNFDAGVLDAKFHELTYGNSADKEGTPAQFDLELKGAKITGNRFAGGEMDLPLPNGGVDDNGNPAGYAVGGFYGENAEEIGGAVGAMNGYSYLEGTWNGVAQ